MLSTHEESLELAGQLKQAIDSNDLERVKADDDSQPGAPSRPAWLRQEWAVDVGCRMPRADGCHPVKHGSRWRGG